MNCTCAISADCDDMVTILSEKWVRARQYHKCGECGKEIENSESYYRENIVYEGDFSTIKTCADCISIRRVLVDGFFYGGIRELVSESIRECGGEISEEKISKLAPAARAWICELIEEEWEGGRDEN